MMATEVIEGRSLPTLINTAVEGASGQETQPISKLALKQRIKKSSIEDEAQETTNVMYSSEKDPSSFPDGGKDAYLTLLGSFMGLIVDFGIANSLGAIESYVSSHQLQNVKESSVSWVFSLHLGVMYLGGVIFGDLFDRFGSRKLLISATIFMTVGLFCTAESTKLSHFILSFGITTAIGTSMGMAPLIGVLSHWFLKKRALACSLATIGGLLGSSVFAIMLQKLYDKVGFKWAIRILGFITIFCMSISILLIKERDMRAKPVTPEAEISEFELEVEPERRPMGQIIKEFFKGVLDFNVCKDPRFIWLVVGVFTAELVSMSTLTYLTSYALDHGMSDSNSYLLITLVNICGIPSRLLSGVLADMYGRFNVMIVMSLLTTIVVFGVWLPSKDNNALLFVFAVLFGVATSATISLIPASTSQICSADRFGKVYGTLYFFLSFLTLLGMYIASVVLGSRTEAQYQNFVFYIGGLCVAATALWVIARYSSVGMKWCKF